MPSNMTISKLHFRVLLLVSALILSSFSSSALAQPTISLTNVDSTAAEAGQETAGFTVTRTDDANTAALLRVFVKVEGTATFGVDYSVTNLAGSNPGYIDIQPNELSRSVVLTPRLDNFIEGEDTIKVTLLDPLDANHQYTVGSPSVADFTLSDDVAEVILTLDDGEAAEAGQDPAGFTVTRNSQGNPAVLLRVFVRVEGTATFGVDYSVTNLAGSNPGYIDIQPNELSRSVVLTPALEMLEEENETIIITLLDFLDGNHQYTVGTPSQAEAIILDFRDLVFSDSFEQ